MFANGGSVNGVQILSEESVTEMKRVQYPDLDSTQGLIWYSRDIEGTQYFGHGGGDSGVATRIGFREDGVGFVVLMNASGSGGTLNSIEEVLLQYSNEL